MQPALSLPGRPICGLTRFMGMRCDLWRRPALAFQQMQRRLTPEILDSLGPEDPAASHSRRDLRVINLLMGNHRWFARVLPGVLRADDRILEIGAGSGELCRLLTRRGMATDGLDQVPDPWYGRRAGPGTGLTSGIMKGTRTTRLCWPISS